MSDNRDDDGPAQYASPPCFMHELDPAYQMPLSDWTDVRRWRKAERERLIGARLAVSADARAAMSQRIAEGLDMLVGKVAGLMVSLYWPFRGEPDLRGFMASINARGGRTALPVVIEKGQPLVFRAYAPGDRLEKGVWNIPIPA
ncbi:MAG: 5-formyltetrahydrofolate cyclo-ligase, partial [Mesorhizobium sp.]